MKIEPGPGSYESNSMAESLRKKQAIHCPKKREKLCLEKKLALNIKNPLILGHPNIATGKKIITPGPGSYNIEQPLLKKSFRSDSKSIFNSSAPRFTQYKQKFFLSTTSKTPSETATKTNPKPNKTPVFDLLKPHHLPLKQSPHKRVQSLGILRQRNRESKNEAKNELKNGLKRPLVEGENLTFSLRGSKKAKKAPFQSSEQRFKIIRGMEESMPGPGSYSLNLSLAKKGAPKLDFSSEKDRIVTLEKKKFAENVLQELKMKVQDNTEARKQYYRQQKLEEVSKAVEASKIKHALKFEENHQRKLLQEATQLVSDYDRKRMPVEKTYQVPAIPFQSKVILCNQVNEIPSPTFKQKRITRAR